MGDRITPTTPPAEPNDAVLDGIDGQIGPINAVLEAARPTAGGPDPDRWALVHTGLLSDQPHLVPLRRAQRQGNRVLVPYDRATISTSPPPQALDAAPEGEYLVALTAHYTHDQHRLAPTNEEILEHTDTTGPRGTESAG